MSDRQVVMSINRTKIVVLGHTKQQFDTIHKRDYLYFCDLNDLNNLEICGFDLLAEGKSYFCEDLFSGDFDFLGNVTASWNLKYSGENKIDNFDKWKNTTRLFSEDGIVLCANTININAWFLNGRSLLRHIGFLYYRDIILFLEKLGLDIPSEASTVIVPLSNQIIANRTIFLDKLHFMRKYMSIVVDKFKSDQKLFSIENKLSKNRPLGYISELVSALWYFNCGRGYTILENERMRGNWYSPSKMFDRIYHNKYYLDSN